VLRPRGRRRRRPAPTPLSAADLLAVTRRYGADVLAGLYPATVDAERRWSARLHADDYLDVWLITWTRDQSTELHDHAGSLGALTVISGELTELSWPGRGPLVHRVLETGRGASFPLGHVHDVVNRAARPAVSVHAYSPPLTTMSYYEIDTQDCLRRTRSVLTDVPEPAAVAP
jgi:predicted metal-dependent enzyme (double-stranded beta helix superfamily)